MVRSVYGFHMYYHIRQGLKRLQVPLPHEASFNAADNPYSSEGFFKLCMDCKVPHDSMKYKDEKFYWTYQQGVKWLDDYIGPHSMTCWIINKSQGFTDVGLLRISESIRAYAYLVLSSTLYTSITNDLLKSRISNLVHNDFTKKDGSVRYAHINVTRTKGYFTNDINGSGDNMYTADNI